MKLQIGKLHPKTVFIFVSICFSTVSYLSHLHMQDKPGLQVLHSWRTAKYASNNLGNCNHLTRARTLLLASSTELLLDLVSFMNHNPLFPFPEPEYTFSLLTAKILNNIKTGCFIFCRFLTRQGMDQRLVRLSYSVCH